jgi:hypothetical protein
MWQIWQQADLWNTKVVHCEAIATVWMSIVSRQLKHYIEEAKSDSSF